MPQKDWTQLDKAILEHLRYSDVSPMKDLHLRNLANQASGRPWDTWRASGIIERRMQAMRKDGRICHHQKLTPGVNRHGWEILDS